MKVSNVWIITESNYLHTWLCELVKYLEREGFRVFLVTLQKQGAIHKEFIDSSSIFAWSVYNDFLQILKFARLVIQNRDTALFALGHRSICFAMFMKVLTKASLTICFVQQARYFELMKLSKSKNTRLRGTFHEAISRFYLQKSDYIQSVSLETTEKLHYIGRRRNIIEIPLGVSDSFFLDPIANRVDNVDFSKAVFPYILSIGRLAPEKNHQHTILVFNDFIKTNPTYHLIIAGDGSQKVALQNLIDKMGLASRVHLIGFVTNLFDLIDNSSLFVHSSYTEGYASVQMEVRLRNKPIVSTPTGVALDMERLQDPLVKIVRSLDTTESVNVWVEMIAQKASGNWSKPRYIYLDHSSSRVFMALSSHFKRATTNT